MISTLKLVPSQEENTLESTDWHNIYEALIQIVQIVQGEYVNFNITKVIIEVIGPNRKTQEEFVFKFAKAQADLEKKDSNYKAQLKQKAVYKVLHPNKDGSMKRDGDALVTKDPKLVPNNLTVQNLEVEMH